MNKYLVKDIYTKLLKFSGKPLSREELESIKEFSVNNFTYSGELKGINLEELKVMPNIEKLTLQRFQISDEELKALENLESLKDLFFSGCSFNAKEFYEFPNLSSIEFNTCKYHQFPKIKLPKIVYINCAEDGLDLGDLTNLQNVEYITMQNIKKIKDFNLTSQMQNLKKLNIDGSDVDDKKTLKDLSKKIQVSHESNSYPIR